MRAHGAPLSLVCRTLGVSRAGFYKWQHSSAPTPPRQEPRDKRLAQRIRSTLGREETFGCRRVWAWLRLKEGVVVNRKTVHRDYATEGLASPCPSAQADMGESSTVDQPDRLWATDTTKIWCVRDG
ncbi:hypothetical protein CLG94_04605 [Candidatus Methylomirabilis limnetica]|uniref:HTH-like domain-containing protein n=1 Tax=Candidatus Methylomirabilis limnetica TaxID=2033718 RepID=A0A2T4TYY7_9BACT|nr:IS3 family transposase [Candidatus Methylomirabilis limnetica]PTL36323.1 hypothetical protein CLG94_04605 [Candidatus Methylomirabilis limnetica]